MTPMVLHTASPNMTFFFFKIAFGSCENLRNYLKWPVSSSDGKWEAFNRPKCSAPKMKCMPGSGWLCRPVLLSTTVLLQ